MIETSKIHVVIHHGIYLPGWPEDPALPADSVAYYKHTLAGTETASKGKVRNMSLRSVFTTKFSVETFLVAYAPIPVNRRVNSNIFKNQESLASIGGCLKMQLFLVDIDCHVSKEEAQQETEEERFTRVEGWYKDERSKIQELQEAHPGILAWRSKNGYRLLGLLRNPIELRTKEDLEQKWKREYSAWLNYLRERFDMYSEGKTTGDKLDDFCRHQRVPHDSHISKFTVDRHEVLGDINHVGYWEPPLEDGHYPAVKAAKAASTATDKPQGCLLLKLVQNRGLRYEPVGGSAGHYDIDCPDFHNHSAIGGKKTYFSKTRLLADSSIGSILCMSSGCNSKQHNPLEWLDSFSVDEVIQAEKDLGRDTLGCGKPELPILDELPRGMNPRIIEMITKGLPIGGQNEEFFLDHSRAPIVDRAKKPSTFVFEIMCGLVKAEFPLEKVLGVFQGFKLSQLKLDERYLRFMLRNAVQSVRLTGSTETLTVHPDDRSEYYKFLRSMGSDEADLDDNIREFYKHKARVHQSDPGHF